MNTWLPDPPAVDGLEGMWSCGESGSQGQVLADGMLLIICDALFYHMKDTA